MPPTWFKPRGYRHLDVQVGKGFAARVQNPDFVSQHSFSPLLHYMKKERRYKKCPDTGKRILTEKTRPIKYASHRDSCIYSFYAYKLNKELERFYSKAHISDSVIAYRALGRSNYHFSSEVLAFCMANYPVVIIAFDVANFFDTLDHVLLKRRLKSVLNVSALSDDWIKVLRNITRFHYVDLRELKAHPKFGPRFKERSKNPIATISELKAEGIIIHPNPEVSAGRKRGVPQGTPISAAASNLYMVDFDKAARSYCDSIGALYRRYSDDILIVCKPEDAADAEAEVQRLIAEERLEIQPAKTERTPFDATSVLPTTSKAAQYLGFTLHEAGPAIRESSLARQWRKMKRAFRKTRRVATARIAAGLADKVYTKRLRRRFSHIKIFDGTVARPLQNFSSYARRSADAFGEGDKIMRQVRRIEQAAEKEFNNLKALTRKKP